MSTITLPPHGSLSDALLTFFRIFLFLFPLIFITSVLSHALEPWFPLAWEGMNLLLDCSCCSLVLVGRWGRGSWTFLNNQRKGICHLLVAWGGKCLEPGCSSSSAGACPGVPGDDALGGAWPCGSAGFGLGRWSGRLQAQCLFCKLGLSVLPNIWHLKLMYLLTFLCIAVVLLWKWTKQQFFQLPFSWFLSSSL